MLIRTHLKDVIPSDSEESPFQPPTGDSSLSLGYAPLRDQRDSEESRPVTLEEGDFSLRSK